MPYVQRHYTLRFLTPAFLGNAEQVGEWRTPPFKAQLRQWWRVAYAAHRSFAVDMQTMRREEGQLLGNAWLENDFRKSPVRLRLSRWETGKLAQGNWQRLPAVTHPEVRQAVGSDLYLGFGPVLLPRGGAGGPTLKNNAAIQVAETAGFSIAYPQGADGLLDAALALMHRYGSVGGRSRNGWGSFDLIPQKETPPLQASIPLRDWRQCLDRDWPHALGKDARGALIWQTEAFGDWKGVMKRLAELKIGLRTQFRFTSGRNAPQPEGRHWLSYPVTNHSVRPWGNNARLPNSLRFKIRETAEGKVAGVIFHMPHLPPAAFSPSRAAVEPVWQQVHAFLDAAAQKLTRIAE